MARGVLKVKVMGDASHLNSTLSKIGPALAGIGVAAAAGFGAAAKVGFDFNSAIQQNTISLTSMLGSQGKANALIKQMTEFAAKTPFEFPEIAETTKKLIAYGVAEKDIIKTETMLGDIASGLGIPFNELGDIYGKLRVQGRAYAEDINQLQGRGIPIVQELAKQFGVSEGEVRKLVEQGKVGFPEVDKALQAMVGSGGKFGGLMEAQSKSFAGQISTIKDSFAQLAGQLTAPAFEYLSSTVFPALISGAGTLMQKLTEIGGPLGLFKGLWEQLSPVLQPVVDMFGRLWGQLQASSISFGQLSAAMAALNPIMGLFKEFWPMLLPVIEQVGSIIIELAEAVLPLFAQAWQLVLDIAAPILEAILDLVMDVFPVILATVQEIMPAVQEIIGAVLGFIKKLWDEHGQAIMQIVTVAFGVIKKVVDAAMTVIKGIINVVLGVIRGDWSTVWEGIKGILSGVWEAIKTIVKGALEILKSIISAAMGVVRTLFETVWGEIKSIFSDALSAISDVLSGAVGWLKEKAQAIADAVLGPFKWLYDKLVGHSVVPDMVTAIMDEFTKLDDGLKEKIQAMATAIQDKFGRISDLVKDAYERMRESALSVLDKERDDINRHYDQRITDLEKFYDDRARVVDEASNAQIAALYKQLDDIDAAEQARQDAIAAAERAAIADPDERARAEASWQEELRRRELQSQKDAIRNQIDVIREQASETKETLKKEEADAIAVIQVQRDEDLKAWEERKTAVQSYFDSLTSDAKVAYRTLQILSDEYSGQQKALLDKLYAQWSSYFTNVAAEQSKVNGYFTGSTSASIAATGTVPTGSTTSNTITINVSGSSGLDIGRQIATALAGI